MAFFTPQQSFRALLLASAATGRAMPSVFFWDEDQERRGLGAFVKGRLEKARDVRGTRDLQRAS